MANTIITKNSSTASAVPTSGDLVQGELAVNVTDKRLFTEDSGGTVVELGVNPTSVTTGNLSATGTTTLAGASTSADITFGDNDKAVFGAGSDLQIYHDGSNSYISDQGTGNLILAGNNVQIMNSTASANYITGTNGAGVTLHYNGPSKLATTSTGIDVTGTVVADGLGIGTSSPNGRLQVTGGTTNASNLATAYSAAAFTLVPKSTSGFSLAFGSGPSDFPYIQMSAAGTVASHMLLQPYGGNVGIGTSSPSSLLHLEGNVAGSLGALIYNSNNLISTESALELRHNRGNVQSSAILSAVANAAGTADLKISVSGAERMRLTSAGDLLVGTTTILAAENNVEGISLAAGSYGGLLSVSRDGSRAATFNRKTSDGEIVQFRKDGTTVGSIRSFVGDTIIGNAGTVGLRFDEGAGYIPWNMTTNAANDNSLDLGASSARFKDLYLSGAVRSGFLGVVGSSGAFNTASRFGVDHAGGYTRLYSSGANDATKGGFVFRQQGANGVIDAEAMRITPTGALLVGTSTSSGSFKLEVAGSTYINGDTRLKSTYPILDNIYDVGTASFRWDDIFATNGTIQTSDRNEKQDIETLSEAEARVAVACKGLLRKFRWKDSVAEKGDEARIHFGIIAQDLQDAFSAEGLDAGRYAMFISSTWTDEETGEERTRLGVRYPELLAFIIAAI
jgi:hypothetical protein